MPKTNTKTKEGLFDKTQIYHQIFNQADDIILLIDRKGRIFDINNKIKELSGYKREDLVGKKLTSLKGILAKESIPIVAKNFIKRMAGRKVEPYEIILNKKNGEKVWVEIMASAIRKKDKIIGDLAIVRDISERKRAQAKLLKSERRFRDIALSSADFIWELDVKGRYVYASGNVEKILGYRPEEIIGMTPFDLMTDKEAKKIKKVFRGIVKEKKIINDLKNWNITKSGKKVYLLTNGVPIIDHKGDLQGYRGVDKDITRVEEIDRMKSEFVTVASHQMRTPLTSIKWFLEILLSGKDGQLNAKQKKMLGQAVESNERMIKLINNLLNVSRIESGRIRMSPVRTQLEDIVKSTIVKYFSWAKSSNIKIKFNKPKKRLPKVRVDVEQTRQVIQNLISNAIKYSVKGNITISLRKVPSTVVERLRIAAVKKGFIDYSRLEGEVAKVSEIMAKKEYKNFALFSIKDQGVGIPKYQQKRVFQKFYRGDNVIKMQTEGSGLGLYICKAIVESLGGSIWFESNPDKGTAFYFTVPI